MYWPTHGPPITEPRRMSRHLSHIGTAERTHTPVQQRGHTIPDMVEVMYADVDPRLHRAAGRSVFAHLLHMAETGRRRQRVLHRRTVSTRPLEDTIALAASRHLPCWLRGVV